MSHAADVLRRWALAGESDWAAGWPCTPSQRAQARALADLMEAASSHIEHDEKDAHGPWCDECGEDWPCAIGRTRIAVEDAFEAES